MGTHRPASFVMVAIHYFVELREVVFHCSLFLGVKTEQGNVDLFTKQTSKISQASVLMETFKSGKLIKVF